jgi:hypothetical protein
MTEIVTSNAFARFNELSAQSSSIQAAIAYWCMPHEQLSAGFLRGVAQPDGFLCCDLHSPTSVSCLSALKAAGGNVHLLLYQLVGKTEVPDSKGIPDHLMHSKVLVFNMSEKDCVVWIGSHNGTKRALHGINFECAIAQPTPRGSQLHSEVMNHLLEIRGRSTAFSVEDADYYRALQGGLQADGFIEIEDRIGTPLDEGEEITVFSTNPTDHQQLTKVGSKLYLSATDQNGRERIYPIRVIQTGVFNNANRHSLTFGVRRYAFKDGPGVPLLTARQAIPQLVYDRSAFYAVVAVDGALQGVEALEVPPETLWRDVQADDLRPHLNAEAGARPRFRIQRAAREIVAPEDHHDRQHWDHAFLALSLDARRSLQSSSLFRRRILKSVEDKDS